MRKLIAICLILTACAHRRPVLPDVKDVTVAREAPGPKCRSMGPIGGRTQSARGTREDALKDLKLEAANKGANYVVVGQWSAYGTAVTGEAFTCP